VIFVERLHMIEQSSKVSVYISTHNRLDRLKRALNSVVNQDYNNIEILVCDDASSDGTYDYMTERATKDPRIIYLRNENNKGACATRNLGIFYATGKFITGLDDDDEFTSDRISNFLNSWDDRYSFICCNFINRYPNINDKAYYATHNKALIFDHKKILFENEASNQIFTLTSRLKDIGGFDVSVRRLQDWDTWLRLSFTFGDFVRLPHVTYIMNHDHLPTENRVSREYKITDALLELVHRNHFIYSKKEKEYMFFLVSTMQKNADFKRSIYWSIKNMNVKFFIKYLLQYTHQ